MKHTLYYIFALMLLGACKKEVEQLIPVQKPPVKSSAKEITAFSVKHGNDSLVLAIKDTLITGTWPGFIDVRDSLKASITATGRIELVSRNRYKVTAEDSSTRFYTVRVLLYNGLPILRLNPVAAVVDKENYITTPFVFDVLDSVYKGSTTMRGRGNSTWNLYLPKLPYKLKWADKVKILGFPADKEWAILANWWDNTNGLRNDAYFEISERLGMAWTPRRRFVDVILSGKPNGTYLLTETIKQSADRVNIDTKAGGWLAEITHSGADDPFWFGVNNPVDDPNRYGQGNIPADLKEGSNKAGTKKELDTLYTVLYRRDWAKLHEIFDMGVYVNWFIVNELSKNNDAAFHSSVYLQKVKTGDKITMGPCWDGDLSAGNPMMVYDAQQPEGWRLNQAEMGNMLFLDPLFKSMLKTRWNERRSELAAMPDYVEKQADYIKSSANTNNGIFEAKEAFSSTSKNLKNWYASRFAWMDAEIKKL